MSGPAGGGRCRKGSFQHTFPGRSQDWVYPVGFNQAEGENGSGTCSLLPSGAACASPSIVPPVSEPGSVLPSLREPRRLARDLRVYSVRRGSVVSSWFCLLDANVQAGDCAVWSEIGMGTTSEKMSRAG